MGETGVDPIDPLGYLSCGAISNARHRVFERVSRKAVAINLRPVACHFAQNDLQLGPQFRRELLCSETAQMAICPPNAMADVTLTDG
jgi:hypothetical protein